MKIKLPEQYQIEEIDVSDFNVQQINQIETAYPKLRQRSKGPTFALTYQGTKHTLINVLGFPAEEAERIETNYHELYKVSDEWVQARLDEAAKCGYVEVAFGLRLRTPLLAKTLRNRASTPYEAQAEARTAGNALGQSYGLLTNRSVNAFMEDVWASEYRLDIKPAAQIHDAGYFLVRDDVEVVHWLNQHLIKEMQWQELPELQHPSVKLGATLELYHPDWATPVTIPNNASKAEIRELCKQHVKEVNE